MAKSNNPVDLYDFQTKAAITIDLGHHEVHEGSHFIYADHVPLNDSGVQNYLITTPNTTLSPHMVFKTDGTTITQFEVYEGADRVGDVLQTVGNNNRNSDNTATTTIHKGYTGGTTDGTRVFIYKSGSSTNQSKGFSGSRSEQEIILKTNTKYILRVTSGSDGNLTNVQMLWYEHEYLVDEDA